MAMTKTKLVVSGSLAPYESGCELTNCKGCPACWRSPTAILRDAVLGFVPKTKQGVANLDVMLGTRRREHEHRFAPVTYTTRNNTLNTTMRCYCGAEHEETEDEIRARHEEVRNAEEDDYWLPNFSHSRRVR